MIVLNKLIHYGSFREQDSILKEKFEKLKTQLTVVVRLFVIMGIKFLYSIYITIYIAGVPFILELVTAVIAHEYGMDATCYLTMSVDTLNLLSVGTLKADTLIFVLVILTLQGVLIFLVIVAKKSVWLSLKETATSYKTRLQMKMLSSFTSIAKVE